ncbi:MAG TPA: c-type cytochrome [Stellaceae bacterium]|nr:c-type cytochrome [Stellaceae bacterium]
MRRIVGPLVFVAAAVVLAGATPAARAESGADLFNDNCVVCHSTEPGIQKLGPSLAGVVGRKSASLPDYPYSPAMTRAGLVWTKPVLEKYLAKPQAMVPGTKMTFPGLKSAKERAALVGYLATLKN